MTKADRQELDTRLDKLGYWSKLAYTNAIEQGVTSKTKVLKELREENNES